MFEGNIEIALKHYLRTPRVVGGTLQHYNMLYVFKK
jgi:hypothetical protein